MKPINSHGFSRRWLGVGMSLIASMVAQADTTVTFQVDMTTVSSPTPPAYVSVSGSFNGWPSPPPGQTVSSGNPVTNSLMYVQGSTKIWTNTYVITDPPGTVEQYKFQSDTTGWEGINNRTFTLGADGTTQVLPVVYWNDIAPNAPTNWVTFQVDMTPQVITKIFTNGVSPITVSGNFEGWDAGLPLTNNPALPGTLSNLYSGTLPVVGYTPVNIYYKFRENGGWEDDQPTPSKNREATITSASQVLPIAFYNNVTLSDLMLQPTLVNFSLYCPNGTPDKDGVPFVKGTTLLFINGNFFNGSGSVVPVGTGSYWTWTTVGVGGPANCLLTESDIPDVYTNSFLLPAGSKVGVTYKYSMDGYDVENGFQTNHYRVVRSVIPAPYTFPQDMWSYTVCPPGTPYPNPGISSTNIVEPEFGYLKIGAPSGGNLPLTWLGRQAVVVQERSSLNSGVWISDNATDGLQATNVPNSGGNTFFRLMKKP